MRIVVNGWFAHQMATGSGQYLEALAAWLPKTGPQHAYFMILPAGAAQANFPGWQAIEAGTPFDRLNENLAKLWFEQVTFPRLCRRLRAGAALVPYWGSALWQPCPLLVTVHDIIPLLLPLYRGGPLQRAYTWLVSRTVRRATVVLTDSEASRRDIIRHLGIPPDRVQAVHLAADPRFQRVRDAAELRQVQERYGLPTGPFLLYLGGFDARKNVPRTLEAYARLRGQHGAPWPPLVIAGKLPAADSDFAPDPRRRGAPEPRRGRPFHRLG